MLKHIRIFIVMVILYMVSYKSLTVFPQPIICSKLLSNLLWFSFVVASGLVGIRQLCVLIMFDIIIWIIIAGSVVVFKFIN